MNLEFVPFLDVHVLYWFGSFVLNYTTYKVSTCYMDYDLINWVEKKVK